MSTAIRPRITLELVGGADPIQGCIEHVDGSRQPFWGWLELIEALQRVANATPTREARGQHGQSPKSEDES
jgi:hypothetical protein